MWEKIKNFFKWIADHTGISWIARKISSGWKWLFGGKANATQQNTSQQEGPSGNERQETRSQSKDNTLPKAPSDEPILGTPNQTPPPGKPKELVVDKHEKAGKLELEKDDLILWLEQSVKIENYKDSQSVNEDGFSPKLLLYLRCDKGEYRITGRGNNYHGSSEYVIVKSILKKNEDGNYIDSNTMFVEDGIENVKKMLGLSDGVTKIKVDSISNSPFEVETLEQPVSGSEVASPSGSQFTTADFNEPNFVQQNTKPESYLEFTDNKLLFITTNKNYKDLEAKYKNEDQEGKVIPGEFRVFVRCDDEDFCITGSYDSQQNVSGGKKSVSITSVRKQNPQSLVSSDPSEMMYKVGLDENRKFVEITRISNKPFGAPTLEQPKPNTTTTQQTVNNNSNGEATAEIKQASSSTTAGLTEQLPEVNSTQELSTPNNEPVKIDTSDQPKSPAVPDEPQRPVINTSETDAKELPENFPTPNPKNADSDVLKGASNENYLKVEETPNSKELKRESSTINVFNRSLELRLADDIQQKLEDYKNPKNNSKYRIKIHCSKGDFNINFSKKENEDGSVSLFISTLRKINDKQVLNDINKIKSSLGFKKGSTFVVIDSIQKYQPSAKPDGQAQGSGDESNQSSFDNESVKDDDKEADNPQPEISANGSAPTDSSSFDIVSSQETTPDELQEPDEDKELARQSEADQKAPANDDGPNSLVAKPEVQTASNDLSHKSQSQ